MKPEDEPIFHALTPQRIGGLTNYLEAGGEPDEGKIAQAWVIRNRVDHPSFQGNSVLTVCYHEAAFSCFLAIDNPEYSKAVAIAKAFDIHLDATIKLAGSPPWARVDALALQRSCEILRSGDGRQGPEPLRDE